MLSNILWALSGTRSWLKLGTSEYLRPRFNRGPIYNSKEFYNYSPIYLMLIQMNSNVQNSISMPELKRCFFVFVVVLVLNGHSGKAVNQHKTIVISKLGGPKMML